MKLKSPYIKQIIFIRWLFIAFLFLLFSYSSINKVINYSYFKLILSQLPVFRSLNPKLIEFISLLIIVTEFVIGMGILLPTIRKPIALLGIVFSILICIVTLIMILNGEKSDCGCFTPFLANEFNFIKLYQNIMISVLFITILFDVNYKT